MSLRVADLSIPTGALRNWIWLRQVLSTTRAARAQVLLSYQSRFLVFRRGGWHLDLDLSSLLIALGWMACKELFWVWECPIKGKVKQQSNQSNCCTVWESVVHWTDVLEYFSSLSENCWLRQYEAIIEVFFADHKPCSWSPPLERFKISPWHWCNQNYKILYSLQQRQVAATAFVERLEYLLPPDCPATLYERWSCAKGQRDRGCGMVKDVNWWPNGRWNLQAYHVITSHITNDRSIETIWHCFTWYLHDVTGLLKEFWQGDMKGKVSSDVVWWIMIRALCVRAGACMH